MTSKNDSSLSRLKKDINGTWIQTLAGDQTDGYAGVPGYGVKTAAKLFKKKDTTGIQ